MSLLSNLKSYWPILLTFLGPRIYNYILTLKTSYRTRPPPRLLDSKTSHALNILFISTLLFLIQSWYRRSDPLLSNVFSATSSRLSTPIETIFSRLALLRPATMLTAVDQKLRSTLISSKEARTIYLQYGPEVLLDCSFCHPTQPATYGLYAVSSHVLPLHLLHAFVLGATSTAVLTGTIAASFRGRMLWTALALLVLDLTLTVAGPGILAGSQVATALSLIFDSSAPKPTSMYVSLRTLRPFSLMLLDLFFALQIYCAATGRFVFLPFLTNPSAGFGSSSADLQGLQIQIQQMVNKGNLSLMQAQSKLSAYTIARNTVLRDSDLRAAEEVYLRQSKRREQLDLGSNGAAGTGQLEGQGVITIADDDEIWKDQEVMMSVARVYGNGGGYDVNAAKVKKEIGAFVESVTVGLDQG